MPRGSSGHTFLVVVGSARAGRCKYCNRPAVWAIALTKKGARSLLFTKSPMFAPEVRAENGVRYEQWPSDLLHVVTCERAPARAGAGR